jgi:hypothetical protein
VSVTAGSDTAASSFTVLAAAVPVESGPTVPAGSPIISDLAPLGNKLKWVAYFNNATKSWSLYDRSRTFRLSDLPAFQKPSSVSQMNALTNLVSGDPYWFFVSESVTVELKGNSYTFSTGASLEPWQ